MVEKPSSTGPRWDAAASSDADSEVVKITVSIGRDTQRRLDGIVEHGGFGGRGRALDSLLEALEEIVNHTRQFNANLSQSARGENHDADAEALKNALFAAVLAFSKFERFYGLKLANAPPAGVSWPPPGGWWPTPAGAEKKET